jgi:hypothetical protein
MSSENSLDQLVQFSTLLLKALEIAERNRGTLDKVDARSWTMHVSDPLVDVSRFVTHMIDAKRSPRLGSLGAVATLEKYKNEPKP